MKLSKHLGGGKLGLRRYYFRFQQIRITGTSADSKGGWVGHAPPDFCLALRLSPPVFFLISRLCSFGWHMQGCQMCFVQIPAILSTAPDLSFVVIRKQHRETETISIVKPQLIICPYFGWFVTFRCVCVTWQSNQRLRQQQQINFAEETVLTRSLQEHRRIQGVG